MVSATFGKLFSCAVDGATFTQPLWVPGVNISGAVHNVLVVGTQHDSLYAFDADANPCVPLWHVNLIDSTHGGTTGETPVVWNDVGYCSGDVYPEVGVTGAPVIDPATNTIYLVSASEIVGSQTGVCAAYSNGAFFHRLHAIDLLTGSEKVNPPVTIAASVPGTGDGSSGGMVSFLSQYEHNRAGLMLSGGNVYVGFSAHEDVQPYHGWLIGYDESTLQQVAVFNTTPNGLGGADGGIWAGGGAPAVDAGGDIYASTGNGIYDESSLPPSNDYADSTLRLHPLTGSTTTPNGVNLSVAGWFTPYDQASLQANDTDLGSGAPVLLPDQSSTGLPMHLLAHVGKEGTVYLIDRDNMGQYNSSNNSQIWQSFSGPGGFWGSPVFWQNNFYYGPSGNRLIMFSFDPSTEMFNTSAASQTAQAFGYTGTTPSVSSLGASNGILWTLDISLYGYGSNSAGINCYVDPPPSACTGPAILHAYDATNLQTEFWNSALLAGDQAGNAVKFVTPTIANGKVYVSTRTEIDVYGLLPN